jgi:hypothetical protein
MQERTLTKIELLDAVSYALNVVVNTRLLAAPHGIKTTYELAKLVDVALRNARENKEEGDV